jgi:AcrR family transcriptional regulator
MAARRKKNGEEGAKTRTAILDATEKIMREEGYGAVSSRRVAAVAGLKSQLVHYHFGTMDDLFLALFHRSEEAFLAAHARALTSRNPLRTLWEQSVNTRSNRIIAEFMALAHHREAIRELMARAAERTRVIEAEAWRHAFENAGVGPEAFPPVVAAVLMAAVSRALATESALDVSAGHAETRAFIERQLDRLAGHNAGTSPKAGRKGNS